MTAPLQPDPLYQACELIWRRMPADWRPSVLRQLRVGTIHELLAQYGAEYFLRLAIEFDNDHPIDIEVVRHHDPHADSEQRSTTGSRADQHVQLEWPPRGRLADLHREMRERDDLEASVQRRGQNRSIRPVRRIDPVWSTSPGAPYSGTIRVIVGRLGSSRLDQLLRDAEISDFNWWLQHDAPVVMVTDLLRRWRDSGLGGNAHAEALFCYLTERRTGRASF